MREKKEEKKREREKGREKEREREGKSNEIDCNYFDFRKEDNIPNISTSTLNDKG